MRPRSEGLAIGSLLLTLLLLAGGNLTRAQEAEAEDNSSPGTESEEISENSTSAESDSGTNANESSAASEASETHAPAPEPLALLPEEQGPAAPARCGARLAEDVRASVVRVRSGGRDATGFFYTTASLVVTTFGVVERGRGVEVRTADGRTTEAEVIAHDQERGLSLLRTQDPIGRPLQPSEQPPEVGQEIAVAGNPFDRVRAFLGEDGEGLLRATLSFGRVAAVNEAGSQLDLALEEAHLGGPMLDCAGRVLGAVGGNGRLSPHLSLAVRVRRLEGLMDREGAQDPYLGNIQPIFGIGALALVDDLGASFGAYLALGGVLFDQLSLLTRVGVVGSASTENPGGSELSLGRNLQRIESLIGYRFFFDIGGFLPVHLTLSGGVAVTREERSRAEVGLAPVDPECDPTMGACEQEVRITRTQTERWLARPVVSLGLIFGGNLELGYSFEIDVDTPGTFVHGVRIGLFF